MRTSRFFALATIFLALLSFCLAGSVVKGAQLHPDDGFNYVVIGAFSVYKNAVNFTADASKQNLAAKYEMNKNRNLYYVYVLSTQDRQQAIAEAIRLRKESRYNDTWVFHGSFDQSTETVKNSDINPVSEQTISTIKAEDSSQQTENVIAGGSAVSATPDSNQPATQPEEPAKKSDPDSEVSSKSFYFKIYRADDQNQLEGDVNVIDAERTRKIGTYAGNKDVKVSNPGNKEGKVSLVCEVFGFRKVQHDVNYQTPEGEGIQQNENNATVVQFELVRLQKGDIAVMYNVFFFKDAAVMRPESRFEVESLLNMLKENTKYKIKIHGHTNGGAAGKIISLKPDADNFFSLSNTNEGSGSAKSLSQERAEVIRNFLVSNGIDESRMEIKAWGGKRPLYDKHSLQAQSNVRVEIEILEN